MKIHFEEIFILRASDAGILFAVKGPNECSIFSPVSNFRGTRATREFYRIIERSSA
jgi:hypothetical protein